MSLTKYIFIFGDDLIIWLARRRNLTKYFYQLSSKYVIISKVIPHQAEICVLFILISVLKITEQSINIDNIIVFIKVGEIAF